MHRSMPAVFGAVLWLSCVPARGETPTPSAASFSFGAGEFRPDSQDNEGGRSRGLGFSGALGLQFNPYLSAELALTIATQKYDRPEAIVGCLLCNLSDRIDVTTSGASVLGKIAYPIKQVQPYAGAGIGIFRSEAVLYGSLLGFPGDYERDTDTAFAPTALAGVEIQVSRRSALAAEYRYTRLDADFGNLSNDTISLSGASVMLVYRWRHAVE